MDKKSVEKTVDRIDYVNESLCSGVKHILDYDGKNQLMINGIKYTYRELKQFVDNVSGNMRRQAVKKGDYIAIIMENSIEYIISLLALLKIGAVPILISPRWKEEEIRNVMEDANPKGIICCEEAGNNKVGMHISNYLSTYGKNTRNVFYIGDNWYGCKGIEFGVLLEKCTSNFAWNEAESSEIAVISYTSGTTGKPKGVVITHNKCMGVLGQLENLSVLKYEDKVFVIAAMYSIQGLIAILHGFMVHATVKVAMSFSIHDICQEIEKEEDSVLVTQPTICNLTLNEMNDNERAFIAVQKIILAGAFCRPELAKEIEKKANCKVQIVYGMTETTGAVCIVRENEVEDVRINTVGEPIQGVEVKIVDEKRKIVQQNEVGELAVRGYCMEGYYRNDEETQKIMDSDGWLYTGDLAKFYDNKNICIVGRIKDMIIRGGMNVFPEDIEECLIKCESVKDASVVGKAHNILIEQIIAFVVPEEGKQCDIRELYKSLNQHLSNYKVPDKILLIKEMPINASGKISKQILREWAISGIPEKSKYQS